MRGGSLKYAFICYLYIESSLRLVGWFFPLEVVQEMELEVIVKLTPVLNKPLLPFHVANSPASLEPHQIHIESIRLMHLCS